MASLQFQGHRPTTCKSQAPGQTSPLRHLQIISGIANQTAALGRHPKLLAERHGRSWIGFTGGALGAMHRAEEMAQPMGLQKSLQAGAQIAADHGKLQPLVMPLLKDWLQPWQGRRPLGFAAR